MGNFISIVIPNHNGSGTIGKCLDAALSSTYDDFEVIVVDDASEDDSVEIIKGFPCRLIRLERHSGASKARNVGALNSRGNILFFTDSDCLVQKDTLSHANKSFSEHNGDVVVGGTYTPIPHDDKFFSTFQSIFINFSETKRGDSPDYIAAHAMVIHAAAFEQSGGLTEKFLPILEDVEFSHRLRRSGHKLIMNPNILVQHIFNYSVLSSIGNAMRKSMYWTIYSIGNRDVLSDSGTASLELKINAVTLLMILILLGLNIILHEPFLFYLLLPLLAFNGFVNRKLVRAFYKTKGPIFSSLAFIYYITVYAFAVGLGALVGIIMYYALGYSKKIHSLGKIGQMS